jgi:hypothetical protein
LAVFGTPNLIMSQNTISVVVLVLLTSACSLGCSGSDAKTSAEDFTEVHSLLVANCTGDGTCHGNGTHSGMYPHPEFANTDAATSQGYVDAEIDKILVRINSTVLDPMAFGTRRMPPSNIDPDGLTDEQKAVIQAYADSL